MNKRIFERHQVRTVACLKYHNKKVTGFMANISLGGALFLSLEELPSKLKTVKLIIEKHREFSYCFEAIITRKTLINKDGQNLFEYGINFSKDKVAGAKLMADVIRYLN